jgi:uncharacterized protein involved in exopolysaccharide biosynthesis
MANEARIAQIRARLAEIETSIAQLEAQRRAATTLDDIARFADKLNALRAERTALQLELADLEAASVEVRTDQ